MSQMNIVMLAYFQVEYLINKPKFTLFLGKKIVLNFGRGLGLNIRFNCLKFNHEFKLIFPKRLD
ncbi:hypothetical protein GCM10026988_00920 [Vibrio panuliri]